MVAAIAIFGIAWMSDTYFQYAMPQFKSGIVEMVNNYPWTFALALFIVSVFIPNYPSDIATVNFDNTGTTKIGKWYFNHSFMSVGLIGVIGACCLGYLLGQMIIG